MKFIRRFKENSLQKSIGLELETFKEMELGAGKDEQHCRGFYLHYNGKRIGIVATNEGPVFLCNEDKYLLDQHAVHFILKKHWEFNTFIFMWEGDVKLQISYRRSLIQYDEKWVDDSIFDFFSWLYEASQKRKFFAYYTAKNVSAAEVYPYVSLHRYRHPLPLLMAYA